LGPCNITIHEGVFESNLGGHSTSDFDRAAVCNDTITTATGTRIGTGTGMLHMHTGVYFPTALFSRVHARPGAARSCADARS